MKRKLISLKILSFFSFTVLLNTSSYCQTTYDITLNTPVYTQPSGSSYCWREVCCSILSYYGKSTSEANVGNYGSQGNDLPNFLCGDNTYTYTACNYWLTVLGAIFAGCFIPPSCHDVNIPLNGINLILNYFGQIQTVPCYSGVYPWNTTKQEIFGGRPVCARVIGGPFPSGGHFIIIRGVYGDGTNYNYYVMDPRPNYGYTEYSKSYLESYWTHSMLLITPPPSYFVPLLMKYQSN